LIDNPEATAEAFSINLDLSKEILLFNLRKKKRFAGVYEGKGGAEE